MRRPHVAAALVAALVTGAACRSGKPGVTEALDSTVLAKRESHLAEALARPDSGAAGGKAMARWVLPASLAEISGIALTADGRLFAHGDERGQVSEIDYRRGVVIKQFTLGKHTLHEDFEAITVVGDTMYLLASDGKLYLFQEGASRDEVDYTLLDTKLGHECEFEGLAYDPAIHALLLACKHVTTKALKDFLVIYRWPLPGAGGAELVPLTVPIARVIESTSLKDFHPSDITVDPASGNYVLISAQEQALVALTPAGAKVLARALPDALEHTEGVAITTDSILILSDEAGNRPAAIALYRWR